MSNNNYRQQYEKKLGIELVSGSSIHHINFNHFDSKINNLVSIPQSLHDRLNIAKSKLPKLCANYSKYIPYKMKNKDVKLFKEYISVYEELLFWIEIRQQILQFGYQYVLIQYNEYVNKIKEVYK